MGGVGRLNKKEKKKTQATDNAVTVEGRGERGSGRGFRAEMVMDGDVTWRGEPNTIYR